MTAFAQRLGGHLRRSGPLRLRATGIHLAISSVIFVAALVLIVGYWYPGFHFTVDGGWQGVRIMVLVDLVLGPALTLVIYNPFKARRLIVFDLACIGLVQFGALAWGFYAVHSQRPVSVNFSDGEFWSMTAAPMRIEGYPVSGLREMSDRTPALVYVAPPANDDEETRVVMLELLGGVMAHEDPLRFRPFAANWAAVEPVALDETAMEASRPGFTAALESFLDRHGGAAPDYRFFPHTGRYGTCTAVFGRSGDFHGAIGCRAP